MLSRSYTTVFKCVLSAVCCFSASALANAASDAEFQRLLSSPDDPVLNRQFAAAAEARGELRHALAALERVLAAHPDDAELARDYERIRRRMLPAATAVTVQAGASYASNPREAPGGSPRRRDDAVFDAAITVEDERTVGNMRLRSLAIAAGQWNREASELNSGRVSFESGPVFMLSRETWLHVAPGVAVTWLDNDHLYTEGYGAATLGTVFRGLTQTLTARYGWREGNGEVKYSDAQTLEILARLVVSPALIPGDYIYLEPRYRLGMPDDTEPATLVLPTVLGPSTLVSRDVSPPDLKNGARERRTSSPWPREKYI
jgi:hypothetical protein